jgi:hypothetical protein
VDERDACCEGAKAAAEPARRARTAADFMVQNGNLNLLLRFKVAGEAFYFVCSEDLPSTSRPSCVLSHEYD